MGSNAGALEPELVLCQGSIDRYRSPRVILETAKLKFGLQYPPVKTKLTVY
jgi:hypothetical protein